MGACVEVCVSISRNHSQCVFVFSGTTASAVRSCSDLAHVLHVPTKEGCKLRSKDVASDHAQISSNQENCVVGGSTIKKIVLLLVQQSKRI